MMPSCDSGILNKKTWMKTILMGNFATWPGLTINAVQRHFPESEEMIKGHSRKMK